MKFNKIYFLLTVLLFIAEVVIGMFVKDTIIRPYGGDFLVVILVYCFVRSFFRTSIYAAAIGSLMFAYAVEVSQYFHFVYLVGLGNSAIARIIMGTYFTWNDIIAYTLGIGFVLLAEKIFGKRKDAFVVSK